MAGTLGTVQPFRYRGYVFDEVTEDYYLRSRYYRPGFGRFVSADSLLCRDVFCYCNNSPIMKEDQDGAIGVPVLLVAFGVAEFGLYHKLLVSQAAEDFLSSRKWTATNILLQHSLWQGNYTFTDKTDDPELLESVNTVKDIIANDQQTYDLLRPIIKQTEFGIPTPFTIENNPEFSSGDLHFSIQHSSINGTVLKMPSGEWSASLHITDTYDFTELRIPFSLDGLAYDMGKILQFIGSMSQFDIDITVMIHGVE